MKLIDDIGKNDLSQISFYNAKSLVQQNTYSLLTESIATPEMSPLKWVAPNGNIFSSGVTATAMNYLSMVPTSEGAEYVKENVIVNSLSTSSNKPKLLPTENSTLSVERDGKVETYVDYSELDVLPIFVNSWDDITTPNTTRYDPDSFSSYYIYPFGDTIRDDYRIVLHSNNTDLTYDQFLAELAARGFDEDDGYFAGHGGGYLKTDNFEDAYAWCHYASFIGLNSYWASDDDIQNALEHLFTVDGDGYISFVRDPAGPISSFAKIQLFDNNDALVEQFTVILAGDLDGDGHISSNDSANLKGLAEQYEVWASNIASTNDFLKACDFDHNGIVNSADIGYLIYYARTFDGLCAFNTTVGDINTFYSLKLSLASDEQHQAIYSMFSHLTSDGLWMTTTSIKYGDQRDFSNEKQGTTKDGYELIGFSETANATTATIPLSSCIFEPSVRNASNVYTIYPVWIKVSNVYYNVTVHYMDGTTETVKLDMGKYTYGDEISAAIIEDGADSSVYDGLPNSDFTNYSTIPSTMPNTDLIITCDLYEKFSPIIYDGYDYQTRVQLKFYRSGTTGRIDTWSQETVSLNISTPEKDLIASSVPSGYKLAGWHILTKSEHEIAYDDDDDNDPIFDSVSDCDFVAVYDGSTISGYTVASGADVSFAAYKNCADAYNEILVAPVLIAE